MNIPRGWIIAGWALAAWVAILLAVAAVWFVGSSFYPAKGAEQTCADVVSNPRYQPPACPGQVCQFYGPGGCPQTWTLAAKLAVLQGKSIVVPAKLCASACVLAVGVALNAGGRVVISPHARFVWPHGRASLAAAAMPGWFRSRVALR